MCFDGTYVIFNFDVQNFETGTRDEVHCSREGSKVAWKIIDNILGNGILMLNFFLIDIFHLFVRNF